MKANLAPKHSQKIGDNFVLWFEKPNSYVIISSIAYQLLTCYFESKNKEAFIQYLQKNFTIPISQATEYFNDLTSFLGELHAESQISEERPFLPTIPYPNISNNYAFGASRVLINYGSINILQLIHPYLQHTLTEETKDVDAVFDIFSENDLLYFFKNKELIGSYEVSNFHFLQGKVAMQLVTSIYNNTESEWLATFHASTISNGNEAIMIIGESGNGKSTLSAVLMAHGFDLLADDFTPMLAENQHLYRFPAAISIKKGAFKLIEDLFEGFEKTELQSSTSKKSVIKYLPPSTSFDSSQKHFACHKLVMVKYDSDVISELCECSSEKFLETFIPDSWISPQPEHSKQFLNWLKDLKFYELNYSNNDFAVSKFKELFDKA